MSLNIEVLNLNWDEVIKKIIDFIKEKVNNSKSNGIVLGLSGGLDSSVVATLCVKALGKDKVIGLILPDERITPEEDIKDAIELAKKLGIRYHVIKIDDIYNVFSSINPIHDENNKKACGNLRARIRMVLLYYFANVNNFLVAGTGDKSEILIGYFTKYGDGAADLLPIGDLYKTQVRMIAKHLGLPNKIIEKPSSPRLWKNHLAEKEIGLDYKTIDLILYGLFDLKMNKEEIVSKLKISKDIIEKVINMVKNSQHKRLMPPIAEISTFK
ncbi:MAG: NAD+ synthase [Nitrososphaerota archaeon]